MGTRLVTPPNDTVSFPLYPAGGGILTEENGSVYEGEFHDNKRHGEGVQIYALVDITIAICAGNRSCDLQMKRDSLVPRPSHPVFVASILGTRLEVIFNQGKMGRPVTKKLVDHFWGTTFGQDHFSHDRPVTNWPVNEANLDCE